MFFRHLIIAISFIFAPQLMRAENVDSVASFVPQEEPVCIVESAENTVADSVSNDAVEISSSTVVDDPATKFRPMELVFPALAIAIGGAGVKNHPVDTRGERSSFTVDNQLQYLPMAGYVFLGFIPGVKHRHNIGQCVMAGVTGFALMTAVCQGTKRLVKEPRPDTGAKTSFPSGHTATAFLGAELCRLEYGWGYGAAAYVVATGVGLMRLHNNRHWCNDVLAGAGLGVLSADVAYWLLPYEMKLFRRHKNTKKTLDAAGNAVSSKRKTVDSNFAFSPTYTADEKAPGFVFSMTF